MKAARCLVLALATVGAHGAAESEEAKVTPVQKVIELLTGMLEKGKKEKYEEQLQFNTFQQFCTDVTVETKRQIAEGQEKIDKLTADIEKYEARIMVLTKEIEVLTEDITVWTGDIKAATKVREMEKEDYDAMYQDYTESIDALGRAIEVLKKLKDKKGVDKTVGKYGELSLTQVSALRKLRLIPEDARRMLDTFLAQDPEASETAAVEETASEGPAVEETASESPSPPETAAVESTPPAEEEAVAAESSPEAPPESPAETSVESPPEPSIESPPEALGYEIQSHGIIEMLEKLLGKFKDELTDLEKKEKESVLAFELLITDLKANIDVAEEDVRQKTTEKAKTAKAKADAEDELEEAEALKAADEKYLADLTADCEIKASRFKDRQDLRTLEIEAIEKAIEIISSAAVAGNAQKHSMVARGLSPAESPASLSQLRADARSPAQLRVAQFLADSARQLNSRVLAALAVRVEKDPFKKVKKMIKDLIARLMEEAAAEADHKSWCDAELSVNEQTRKEKTAKVEELHAEVDELVAAIAKLTEEIAELVAAIAELDAAMAKATVIREEEKAKNTETLGDAKEAQAAVEKAVTILKEFYAKAAEATALLQDPRERPVKPAIFDEAYTGMQAENGGVIGMLEVIASDFVRLETETAAAEASAQKAYDEFMAESKADKEAKERDIEHKTAKKQDKEQALTSAKEDLALTQQELDASLAYFDKLKPSCINVGVTYEERVAMRKEEIASLQEALKILNGESI